MTAETEKLTAGTKVKSVTKRIAVESVLWTGTASVICGDEERVPAALTHRTGGQPFAVVLVDGEWWDARCFDSREWECTNGNLVGEVEPETAGSIDSFLATANQSHDNKRRELKEIRLRHGRIDWFHNRV